MRGVGIALCPERVVADDIARGRLKRLNWPHAPAETMILMITHVEKWRSPLLEDFMDMAREGIRLE
ncbi:lysR family transcriptional regulator [Desulfovibrio ferrophilus]|uniref:LysR family transcriptional regulator n=1 Tax=Desulfovibrio ferrophilus TaxID=241368 RepID=A0A2Z6B3G9_9BACT|nr:lysR family transcriptional regulator [Desulfovibrio ferrophilus]